MRQAALDRIEFPADPLTECWTWTGFRTARGYGRLSVVDKSVPCGVTTAQAHRLVWTDLGGEIPEGWDLDHLCRNPACVSPFHLEPVTPAENRRRQAALRPDSCRRGHPWPEQYDPKFTRCRACHRENERARQRRK